MSGTECGYCGTDKLAYQLDSDRGRVSRCIPCLAIEQGQQQVQMPFEKFIDLDPGIVYDSEEEVREDRQNTYEVCRSWWTVLARWRQDEPILKRDPDDFGTVHEWTREFLINIMGSSAHYSPSEIAESDGDPSQTTITDGGVCESSSEREDWHPIKREMYDVNDLFEQVETDEARAHIDDAVIELKAALEAERSLHTEDGSDA